MFGKYNMRFGDFPYYVSLFFSQNQHTEILTIDHWYPGSISISS
jgi:hypothetical protein